MKTPILVCVALFSLPVTLVAQLLPPDAMLERVASGFNFTEGPADDGQGGEPRTGAAPRGAAQRDHLRQHAPRGARGHGLPQT